MKSKRDLWIMGATSLVIAVVLFVAIGVGTRRQQQELVKKLDDDVFHGRNESVQRLVTTTDVLVHERSRIGLFLMAIEHCDAATVQTLIDKGISPNIRVAKDAENTPTGFTALDVATISRRADIVTVLVRNGADANLKTDGRTAIDLLKLVPPIPGGKRVGNDAQIAHLLREAQRKGSYHP
ncbi:hypothetical protein IAD21_01494 [Abditibacteriota bacterium]|nr:hypothetical protein IAD21_01494 [Abditibacteriota bacterium]